MRLGTPRSRGISSVYSAGVLQGLALITFPAANAVFTGPGGYGLSGTEYGGMFVPQALMAIAASLLGAGLRGRLGAKRIYLLGLSANLLAMGLLVASRFMMGERAPAYAMLLAATACLGIGFGFTVPALNTFAAEFFPKKADKAVLALNALLGLGTALAPVFAALFVGLGVWWGLPALVGGLILGLLLFSVGQDFSDRPGPRARARKGGLGVPGRFWIFAAFALLYGVCETVNGNWAAPYMTEKFGAGAALAPFALATFWSLTTAGRILFAALEKWFPEKLAFRVLPFVVAAAFLAAAFVPKTDPFFGIMVFALAGLGCSALLPLAISFGQRELADIAASAAGGLIAFYQLGYGIAAFSIGPLHASAGLTLSGIYGGAAVVALVMALLSFVVSRRA